MQMPTYIQALQSAGLTAGEAEIYEILLNLGPAPAQKILKKTELKRGNVYNILASLETKGLLTKKDEKNAKSVFTPLSPNALDELLTKKEEEVRQGRAQLKEVLDPLKSMYALIQEKPVVRFFEGHEGIRTVLYDSLSAKDGVCMFVDMETIETEARIKDLDAEYVKKRLAMNIPKKIIALDTPAGREYAGKVSGSLTQVRLIKQQLNPFKTGMQVYNTTVSYITISNKKMISMIIEDENIARMHQSLFDYIWNTLKPFSPATPPYAPAPAAPPRPPSALV